MRASTGCQLCMDCFFHPCHKLSRDNAAAIGCGNRQLPGFESRDHCFECVTPILDRFINSLPIQDALCKIWKRKKVAATFIP